MLGYFDMTQALYLNDSYLKEANAKVVEVEGKRLELNETIFYPEGGGQETDTGWIEFNGKRVEVKRVKKEGNKIWHYIEGEVPAVGEEVKMVLNWKRRYNHMRMHSAQHILSAIVLDLFNASTVGNQIHEKQSRMDFHPIKFNEEMLAKVKERFDEVVEEKRPVKIYYTSREKVMQTVDEKRRKLFERLPSFITEIRIVEIEGVDVCPCAGTHVKNTSEIGKIKIVKKDNKGKERERLVFELEKD
jgi:misacylated tRNA(Ala) deacylase